MKKRRLKRWVRETIIIVIIIILAIITTCIVSARVDQMNRSMGYETSNK